MQLKINKILLSFSFVMVFVVSNAAGLNDTIPPVFTSLPQDTSFSCDSQIESLFLNWLNSSGGALADNGEADIQSLPNIDTALIQLDSIRQVSCSTTGNISVGFYAIDSCDNLSVDTLFATFGVFDNQSPQFISESQDLNIECQFGIADSLQMWLDNFGYAIINDNCSDTIIGSSYNWIDSNGNSGFGTPGTPTNIIIERTTCLWSVDVTFFIQDECGNLSTSAAAFKIESDNIAPSIVFGPSDITVDCSDTVPFQEAIFEDGCDGILIPSFNESSNQGDDPNLCSYYNYTISRTWEVTDVCSNIASWSQIITVQDITAPEAILQNSVALNCDDNPSDLTSLIQVEDNCLLDTFIYEDNISNISACGQDIVRQYILSDICGNIDTISQNIQIRDFDGPEFTILPKDTIVHCSGTSPLAIFNNWRDNFGFAQVADDCNTSFTKALEAGNYNNTTQIENTDLVMFIPPQCPISTLNNILSFQLVDFVAYDDCGNINIERASFIIIDTIAPTILACPTDRIVNLKANQCDTSLVLSLPVVQDNCSPLNPSDWNIIINDERSLTPDSSNFELFLESGINEIVYTVTDCVDNINSCSSVIEIKDVVPPVLICPEDITIELDQNECALNYEYPQLVDYLEVCSAPIDFSLQQPTGVGFIEFELDGQSMHYQAKDRTISFRDLNLIGEVYNPVLILQYKVNVEDNASINILSELGDILFTIDSSQCKETEIAIPLNATQFGFWLNDNRVNFIIDYIKNNNSAPGPCNPQNLSGSLDKDDDAYFRLVLNYADINPDIETVELASNDLIEITDNQSTLHVGEYQVKYAEVDAFGNEGTCFNFITIEDNIPPTISCKNVGVDADIENGPQYQLIASDLIQNISDNCGIDTITLSDDTYLCNDIGTSLSIEVTAFDANGNSSSCNSIVTVNTVRLEPLFVSNLCFADTLRLFANLDPEFIDSLRWNGPDGFVSTDFNPTILNINSDNSGIYFLRVTTLDGCSYLGSVNISVNEFSNPQITSDSTAYCVGTKILLNASVFTEEVDYQWYEGIVPNGILIAETDGPSLIVNPPVGKHFYYVEVRSEDCSSNASNTITIDVLSIPEAIIDNPFISICAGSPLSLSTSIFNSTYNYLWTGPNGFFSRDRIPEVIPEADLNDQGSYFLVVDNGVCASDTAVAQVIVFPQPSTPVIDGQETVCEGKSALLTVTNITGANRYHWYKDGTLFRSLSSNTLSIPNVSSAQEGIYTVEVEDGICFSEQSGPFELSIEPKLNIGATNNGPVCEGDDIDLISSFVPNATYEWLDPSGETFSGREISVPAISGSYTVIVTSDNNCTATSTTQVTVLPKPSITALSNSSENCMTTDMDIELVATVFPPGQYQYNWTGPEQFVSNAVRPLIPVSDTSINGSYTLTVSQNGCLSDPVSTIVEFSIEPEKAEISGPQIVCEEESILLEVTNPALGMDAEWIWTTPTGLRTTQEPRLSINNTSNASQGIYRVIQSLDGCRSDISDAIDLEVIPTPDQPAIFGSAEVCEGSIITLQTNSVSGVSYLWEGPLDTIQTSDPLVMIENVNLDHTGPYQVRTIIGDCISDPSINFDVIINPLPDSPQFELNDLEVCLSKPEEIIVCVEPDQNNTIQSYEFIDLSTNIRIAQSNQNCVNLNILNTGVPAEFIIGARSNNGNCTSTISDTLVIRIIDIPEQGASIIQSNQLVCNNSFFELNADVPEGVHVSWTSNNPDISLFNTDQATVQLTDITEGRSTIYLFSSIGQCMNFSVDSIEIEVLSEIVAVDDFVSVEYQPTIEINPVNNDLFNQSVYIDEVQLNGPGNISIENNSIFYQAENAIDNNIEIEYTICYEACPDECSTAIIQLEITSENNCFAGNLITPNGDGYNDAFRIPCLEGQRFPDNELVIFNEWGDEVFSASPYNNDWQGTKNGNPLPAGTYFFVLELGEGQTALQGFIVLEL